MSAEVVVRAGRVTDPLGRSLRKVFALPDDAEEQWVTLLRRLQ